MTRVMIAPTLDADTLRSRGLMKIDADDAEGPIIRRPRARENYGEQVCPATIAARARRAQKRLRVNVAPPPG
jgi:hypothetical protein